MSLKVIGAGFGRTGTDSMREALEILGFGRCHHMYVIREDPEQYARWKEVARGAVPDWDVLLDGFGASVDWPTAFFWRELVERFPEAKVVLTWRTPESWWASMEKSILPYMAENPDSVGSILVKGRLFGGEIERERAIAKYRDNVDEVLASVPPERLIVHRLGDGWGPLLAGLGAPEPDVPYPSRNSSAEFRETHKL